MAKPIKRYGMWRIRWKNEQGIRQSAVYSTHKEAESALRKYQTQVISL
jgi:hypothetical protein